MNKTIVLSSGDYSATILTFGAELCSIKHLPSDSEFMWQAEKSVWPRHAPVLFPFVGRLKNFEYRYNGQAFSIEQHGFARDMQFEIVEQNSNRVVLELSENPHTLQRYPFLFKFRIHYQLDNNCLRMAFDVNNNGTGDLPVSFGGHPAFSILEPDDAILIFENDANPLSYLLEENFVSTRTKSVTDGKGQINVNEDTFAKDALIFKHLESSWVKLASKSTGRYVKVSLENWPFLGIWAKPAANFICIEPWQGIADSVDFEGEVNQKEGIIMLSSNTSIVKSFTIEVGI